MNEGTGAYPGISVVIPVRNGAATIRRCLEAIYSQTVASEIECILLDSASNDDTVKIAEEFPVKVYPVALSDFNHGLTRNWGVSHARGELVYFTVQDAWLSEKNTLQRMADHFRDTAVMAVTGIQAVPHEKDKNPVYWYRPVSAPEITRSHFPDPSAFGRLPARKQQELSSLDNVNAMYRKTALLAQPFIETDFAEDMYWGKQALEKGWMTIRDPSLLVWHYHHMNFSYSFRGSFITYYSKYRFFHLLPRYPSAYRSFRLFVATLARTRAIGWATRFYWFFHSCSAFWGEFYAAWVFRRAAGGEASLNEAYTKYCKKVPQGRLKGQAE